MSNPTSNFGWQMPTNTDLVSQLPADFEVFGQAVDTSLADLRGGTTGQVLKKNTDTDMDFVWSSDATGMTNPMTTTGDTIYSSSGSTPARLGIGTTGQVLTVSGGVPAWATPASGGMTLLASGTISGTVNLTSIDQTYEELVLYVWDFTNTITSELNYRFNGDTGANYGILRLSGQNTTSTTEMRNGDTSINAVANDTNPGATNQHSVLRVPNYTAPANKLATSMSSTYADTSNENQIRQLTCAYRSATAISQISILNCTSGNYELWGVK